MGVSKQQIQVVEIMPPSPEKLQAMLMLSRELEESKVAYREAMNVFTATASKLNYMLLEEPDYYGYITRREPVPEWLREIPSKVWMVDKPELEKRSQPKKKVIADKMFSKLMGGFK